GLTAAGPALPLPGTQPAATVVGRAVPRPGAARARGHDEPARAPDGDRPGGGPRGGLRRHRVPPAAHLVDPAVDGGQAAGARPAEAAVRARLSHEFLRRLRHTGRRAL